MKEHIRDIVQRKSLFSMWSPVDRTPFFPMYSFRNVNCSNGLFWSIPIEYNNYTENFDRLHTYAQCHLGSLLLARESQETFCIACKKADDILKSSNPQSWPISTLELENKTPSVASASRWGKRKISHKAGLNASFLRLIPRTLVSKMMVESMRKLWV